MPQLTAPLKFTLPHAVVSFGPAGQLIRISTAFASDGERALVEFHSLEVRHHMWVIMSLVRELLKSLLCSGICIKTTRYSIMS